ncbi:MAG: hypothetical protein WAT22_06455 [Saprospiraceae bacterium]|nr:hypothetical protein [Saprospiraceae bacterium]MBK9565205.1 hypothetical protein [Saprospiraceae bacterium]MBP6447914.1 hypothetical protein [Saprospiraceae bacterium]
MLNKKYTAIPIIIGLLVVMMNIISDNKWVEIVTFSLFFISTLILKNKIIEENKDYGVHIYYTLMVLCLILIFTRWFI